MEDHDAGGPFVSGSLFTYLKPEDQQFLIDLGVLRTFPSDEVIIRQGDPTNHVFIILSGWVRVYTQESTEHQVLHGLRGPGDILGDESALHDWVRPNTVRTLQSVTAVQLLANNLQSSLRERPTLSVALVKNLQVRLREAEIVREDFTTLDVTKRVMRYLVYLANQHGESGPNGITIRIPLTQQDIANRVGASRRAVARAIAMLRDRRLLTSSRRQMVIIQPELLQAFTGEGR